MKVSVVVPVYNLENYIGPCLESLLTQETSFDFDVIVANDCSIDGSLDVIHQYAERFPSQVKVIDQPVNKGLAFNMISLLKAASGEYIAYIDGDDLALPGKLQKQSDYLDQHESCGMVYHESEVFDSETDKTTSHYVKDYYNRNYIPEQSDITHLIRYGSYFQASSLMLRRHDSIANTVDDRCKIILDQPFQVLNAGYLNGKIGRINEVLGRYRIHANSFGAMTLKDFSRREQVLHDQIQAISNGQQFGVSEDIIYQGQAHYYMATAMFFLKTGNSERFNKYIDLSAKSDWRFDERHQFLISNKNSIEKCLQIFA